MEFGCRCEGVCEGRRPFHGKASTREVEDK